MLLAINQQQADAAGLAGTTQAVAAGWHGAE